MNVIITGANRGIGRQTTIALSKLGYTIIMACRDIDAAILVSNEIKESSGNSNIFVMKLDLASSKSIQAFVDDYIKKFKEINILINNAGVSKNSHELTED